LKNTISMENYCPHK